MEIVCRNSFTSPK